MKIYAYPGERVDFVSRSGSAGAIYRGDSMTLVEEFFGPAHTRTTLEGVETIGYFHQAIELEFHDAVLRSITISPERSQREKIEVYAAKTPLSATSTDGPPPEIEGIVVHDDHYIITL